MALKKGETFISGRSRDTAKRLLRAADELGLEPDEVKTVTDGYIVPDAVAKKADKLVDEESDGIEAEAVPFAPRSFAAGEEPGALVSEAQPAEPVSPPAETDEEKTAREAKEAEDADAKRVQDEADAAKAKADADALAAAGGQQAPDAVVEPAKNASKADWIAYASTLPTWEATDADENDGLSRNELAVKYGTPAS